MDRTLKLANVYGSTILEMRKMKWHENYYIKEKKMANSRSLIFIFLDYFTSIKNTLDMNT